MVVYVVSGVPEKRVGSLVHNPIESDINKQRQYIEPYMEISIDGGIPIYGWVIVENPIEVDLGVPPN